MVIGFVVSLVKYSLIIPHFDDSERLERLLRTVPTDRRDLAVIVVDDCSPDQAGLLELKEEWPTVLWLSTSRNSGAGAARNVGLDNATGKWLVFADSDDEFLPNAFENFDSVLRDDDQLVFFLAQAVQERDGLPSTRADRINALVHEYATRPSDRTLRELQLGHVNPVAKIYRRSFIESHSLRFDSVQVSNDVGFNVMASVKAINLRVEPIPVYRIYRRSGSLTSTVSSETFLKRFEVSLSLAERLHGFGVNNAVSATGSMVRALSYGPRITWYVWRKAISSPMLVDWSRVLNLSRWVAYFTRNRQVREERRKNS